MRRSTILLGRFGIFSLVKRWRRDDIAYDTDEKPRSTRFLRANVLRNFVSLLNNQMLKSILLVIGLL
jgi:hypothetical protein